ncbi:C-type lectin domain family 2 member L-like isoform X1 [Cyprinus carpio]|uniref:C-type lectin domain family 2 member L-like isoform X1 n=1 Tax=Cyprinus carpio TaxID=7962 RepID=A0A9Q9XRY2_CYPCA|nr:C-type lectin domain family 2 member L-like isoform X1 [Cyprinus carpio]
MKNNPRSCRGSRCLVLITVCLGIICLLLIAGIILMYFQASSKRGYLWGPDGLFMSTELKSWSDSRQYCRDRGADLVIINTEEKQRHISSFIKERVWIGLSDIENEGNMNMGE